MAHMTKMDTIHSIQALYKLGWSQRSIAKELNIHRSAVKRHLTTLQPEDLLVPDCANPTAGESPSDEAKRTKPDPRLLSGPPSACEPWRASIEASLEQGLSGQRIYQDLLVESGFCASYESVKRYVRHLRKKNPKRFERMESLPGVEAQVDFGTGWWIMEPSGKKRKAHVLRVVLSHSRKGYSEAVFRQDTESFLRCLENALRYFGGVPETLVIDNLKAAIPRADWYDPDVHPKLRDFATYYNVAILPTKPYHPHHKGKVERGIAYVKENALKGKTFPTLRELNAHLLHWETHVADQRVHGTTRKQVGTLFTDVEASALHPLPPMPFPSYEEGRRSVHRDGFVEVRQSYYEAPPEYVGRVLWVRWDSRTVRLFNHRMEEVRVHARVEPGQFARTPGSTGTTQAYHSGAYLLKEAQNIGYWSGLWAEALLLKRGREAFRTLQGLRQLSRKHPPGKIDRACEQALSYGATRLRDLRRLIEQQPTLQEELPFLTEHALIRDLSEYQTHINTHGKTT